MTVSQRNSPAMKWRIECPVAQEKDAALGVQNSQKWWLWILAGEIQHGDPRKVYTGTCWAVTHKHFIQPSLTGRADMWVLCLPLWPITQKADYIGLLQAVSRRGERWWLSPWWLNSQSLVTVLLIKGHKTKEHSPPPSLSFICICKHIHRETSKWVIEWCSSSHL